MRRIGPGLLLLTALALAAAFLARYLGWLDGRTLLDVGMAAVGLLGLGLIVKLPWDLYMQARGLVADQRESRERGIEVADAELRYAKRTARRLLAACLGLHSVTALTIALGTRFSGGQLGYWFAGFFLLATFFRPAVAVYGHLRARLTELRSRTRFPREDAVALRMRVEELEGRLERSIDSQDAVRLEHAEASERLSRRVDSLDREHRARTAAFEDQVDRVLRELERTVDRLTEDREILSGIRAFVRAVKDA